MQQAYFLVDLETVLMQANFLARLIKLLPQKSAQRIRIKKDHLKLTMHTLAWISSKIHYQSENIVTNVAKYP